MPEKSLVQIYDLMEAQLFGIPLVDMERVRIDIRQYDSSKKRLLGDECIRREKSDSEGKDISAVLEQSFVPNDTQFRLKKDVPLEYQKTVNLLAHIGFDYDNPKHRRLFHFFNGGSPWISLNSRISADDSGHYFLIDIHESPYKKN